VTPVSRVELPLPKLRAVHSDDKDDIQFLARVELLAECRGGGGAMAKQKMMPMWQVCRMEVG
jgi:hypothetical protein